MNILVTGAAGFIGSHLCDRLVDNNHFVVGLDNFDDFYSPSIKENNILKIIGQKNFVLIRDDIRNENTLKAIFKDYNIECVFHLAARAGVRPSILNPAMYAETNINGTISILEAMKAANIHNMVFASSSSVYGNQSKAPFSESDPALEPISPYAATKRAGELICYTYHHLYQFNITCLRFFTVYGPRQRPEMAIHQFARNILNHKPISLFGDGTTSRDYTYIDDIIAGVVGAFNNLYGYNIINLGNSSPTTLLELIGLLEHSLSVKAIIEYFPIPPGDVNTTFADIAKATRNFNYRPKVGLQDGIETFCRWFHGVEYQ